MRVYQKYMEEFDFASYNDFKKRFKLNVPKTFNFAYEVVDELAATKPDKLAMQWVNVDGVEKNFTFAEMKRMSDKTANYFKSLGIGRGDRVMVILKRHYEFWFTLMALHKLGAVGVPATHQLMKKDVVYRANAANVKVIVCVEYRGVRKEVEAAMPECPTVEKLVLVGPKQEGWDDFTEQVEAASEDFEPTALDTGADDVMLLYFTSGTSGMPKMVTHNFLYPLAHIITAVFWHGADPEGKHLTVSDSGWMKCVWGKLYGQWLAETCVFVYDCDKFNAANMLRIMEKYKITTFCAPPTIYRYFLQEDLTKYDLSELSHTTTAGEPLYPEVYAQWKELTGLKMMEAFGQTETVLSVGNFLWMKPKPGSMGKPSPLYDVDIVDDDGNSCSPGETGEIIIRTDKEIPVGLFMQYESDPERTNEVWNNGVYHTGDTAWKDETGYFWYVGRKDDVIKTSGYRVGPFEVESVLMEHPAVLEAAVTGIPHPVRGQAIKATIVLSEGYEASDELAEELKQFVKQMTAPYKRPREIAFVKELPKTTNGKTRRAALREQG